MSITNKLNQIKNAIYGKEVRGAIHDAIKECYDDASVNHDNANMEVKMARGAHDTLNDRLDKSDEIQAQTNAQLSQTSHHLNSIGQIAIRLDGEVDDTLAVQRVIDADMPLFVHRNLTISDTINLKLNSVIYGTGKNGNSITMTNDSKFMFVLHTDKGDTAYDVTTSLKVHDVHLLGKNIIQINEYTESDFKKLGHIKGGSFERVLMTGKVQSIITSDIPTQNELIPCGAGIQATKVFDMAIRDCEIERFGIGIDFLGCDINLIDNCRLSYSHRQFHSKRITTYGSQNKLKNCDVMRAIKKGHIYLDGTRWDTVEDCYFESYDENALFIYVYGTRGTSIINNRFDTNTVDSVNEVEIYPKSSYQFVHNRANTSTTKVRVKVSSEFYDSYDKKRLGLCKDNVGFYTYDIPPMYNNGFEQDFYNVNNIPSIGGAIAESYPFEMRDGIWKLKQDGTKNVIITLTPKTLTGNYIVRYSTYDTDGTFHMNIRKNSGTGTILVGRKFPKGSGEIAIDGEYDIEKVAIEFASHVAEIKYLDIVPIYKNQLV